MWLPFKNKSDFELARWFIEDKVPKDQINKYFKQELGPEESTIKSAYRLFDARDKLESGLGMNSCQWKEGFVSFSKAVSKYIHRTSHANRKKEILDRYESEETSLRQRFFFCDLIQFARYLLGERCFAEDLVYPPVKEWNSEEPPQRVYSEMHIAV